MSVARFLTIVLMLLNSFVVGMAASAIITSASAAGLLMVGVVFGLVVCVNAVVVNVWILGLV